MIKSFADIDHAIKNINRDISIGLVVAAAEEEHVLEAVCEAKRLGIIRGILVGDRNKITELADKNGFDLSEFEIINEADNNKAAQHAVQLVREGHAQIIMKGLLDTSVYLKAILDKEKGLKESRLLSCAGVFEIEKLGRLLLITDPAINLEPGLEEKEIIMQNAVSLSHALGNPCPKVAFVCPIEKVNPRMISTIHAKELTEKFKESKDFLAAGPFGLDNAISIEAARIKGISSPVSGNADILVLNDIGVGNVIYKLLVYLADAKNTGIVLGAKVPVLMTSRSDNTAAKLNGIKLCVFLALHGSI